MSSILTRAAEETSESSTGSTVREPMMRAIKMALEEAEDGRSSGSAGREMARTFLVVDLGAVVGYLFGDRKSMSGAVETLAEVAPEQDVEGTSEQDVEVASERATEMAPEPGTDDGGGGRGVLSKLFLLGVVVGLGYAARTRMGSGDKLVDKATDRARSVADEAAMRSGEAAGRTETVTGEAAERIEESGEMAAERIQEGSEMAAERVQEGGEQAADQMEEAGETVENVEEKAEESVGESTSEGDEDGQESEE